MKKLLYIMLAMVALVLPGIKVDAIGFSDFVGSVNEFKYDEADVTDSMFLGIRDVDWWVLSENCSKGQYFHTLASVNFENGKSSGRPYFLVDSSSVRHSVYLNVNTSQHGKVVRSLNSHISEYVVGADVVNTSGNYETYTRDFSDCNGKFINLIDYSHFEIGTLASDFKILTNIPCFYSGDTENINKWVNDGDMSGALNYESLQNMVEPGNQYKNEEGPWLKMGNFDGSGLSVRPASGSYCSWMYVPQNTEGLTDLTLDIVYEHQLSAQVYDNANMGGTVYSTYSESIPLSDCFNNLTVYPAQIVYKSQESIFKIIDTSYMFGGKITLSAGISYVVGANAGVDGLEVTGSNFRVTMKLKGKKNGDWINGPAYFEVVNLLDGSCTEVEGYSDEDGNYTPDTKGTVTDKDGNVTVKNNIDINNPGGGGGGGNSSSSAEGGSASANASVGDITFKFPDKLTVDVNVNGGTGGGGSGSGSSSSDSGSKSWLDRLLDGISALIQFFAGVLTTVVETITELLKTVAEGIGDFLSYLFEGFGLIGVDGGIGDLLQENFSFVPPEVWKLVMFGIAGVILVGIVNKFFK